LRRPRSTARSTRPNKRTDPVSQHPTVTGGPYKFAAWVPGQEIDYVANETYFAGRPHFDKVVARVITDATASTNAIIGGDIQWTPTVAEAGQGAVQKVVSAGNLTVHSSRTCSTSTCA
jgi:ABC-type transport system substrate-binding protein